MDLGWLPHKPETWTHRYARLRNPKRFSHYLGYWKDGVAACRDEDIAAGTQVKIVMVSRLGDVGLTTDLTAESNYSARVFLDELCDFTEAIER